MAQLRSTRRPKPIAPQRATPDPNRNAVDDTFIDLFQRCFSSLRAWRAGSVPAALCGPLLGTDAKRFYPLRRRAPLPPMQSDTSLAGPRGPHPPPRSLPRNPATPPSLPPYEPTPPLRPRGARLWPLPTPPPSPLPEKRRWRAYGPSIGQAALLGLQSRRAPYSPAAFSTTWPLALPRSVLSPFFGTFAAKGGASYLPGMAGFLGCPTTAVGAGWPRRPKTGAPKLVVIHGKGCSPGGGSGGLGP